MIGLSTWAFFWRHSERAPEPLTATQMILQTRELGVGLFQICDYAPLLGYSHSELRDLRATADDLDVRLELGTRGVDPAHLSHFLELATTLGATMVRSMLYAPDSRPSKRDAELALSKAARDYEAAGVTLALETYEQVATETLVDIVESVGSDSVGICLDPANTVARLENPRDVVERCAPHTKNLHVKDFAFTREDGWVGFTLTGTELGTGLLDYPHELAAVDPDARGINQIVEHWLPWQGSFDQTAALEHAWTVSSLKTMKEHQQ
jgi:sugar phosphate isomerase/epimerase